MHSAEEPLTAEEKQFFTELDSYSTPLRSVANEIAITLKNFRINDPDLLHMIAAAEKVHAMNIEQLDVVMDEINSAMERFLQREDLVNRIPSESNVDVSLKMALLGEEANTLFERLAELIKKYR